MNRHGQQSGTGLAGHWAAICAVTFFSSALVVSKSLLATVSVWQIFAGQLVVAAAGVWLVILVTGHDARPRGLGWHMVGLGVLAPGTVNFLNIVGMVRTDGVSVVIIWGLLPLMLPLLGRPVLGEPVRIPVVLGALLGFAGVMMIVFHRWAEGDGDAIGNALVLAAVLCSCAAQLLSRKVNREIRRPLVVASYQITISALIAVVAALLFGGGAPWVLGNAAVLSQLLYLGVFGTVVVFVLLNTALARLEVGRVGLYLGMIPALGTIMAAFLLGEPLGWREMLGVAAIFLGVALPVLLAKGRPQA